MAHSSGHGSGARLTRRRQAIYGEANLIVARALKGVTPLAQSGKCGVGRMRQPAGRLDNRLEGRALRPTQHFNNMIDFRSATGRGDRRGPLFLCTPLRNAPRWALRLLKLRSDNALWLGSCATLAVICERC